jgi:hypothetical protein
MMKLEDLTENQIKQLKESLAAGPLDAIREPLEAAPEGLAEVSGDIEEAKSRLWGIHLTGVERVGWGNVPSQAAKTTRTSAQPGATFAERP